MNTCCRCGFEGPDKDFLVVKGSVSKSCMQCLDWFFKHGNGMRVTVSRAKRLKELKKEYLRY